MLPYNKKLKTRSRELRNNMTEAEKLLWSKIRRKQLKGVQFYRQKPIGNYIVDFYCPARRIVIEIDGGQHYLEEGIEKDRVRDYYLRGLGLTVLRFSNIDVLQNIEGVVSSIYDRLCNPPVSPFAKGGAEVYRVKVGNPPLRRGRGSKE